MSKDHLPATCMLSFQPPRFPKFLCGKSRGKKKITCKKEENHVQKTAQVNCAKGVGCICVCIGLQILGLPPPSSNLISRKRFNAWAFCTAIPPNILKKTLPICVSRSCYVGVGCGGCRCDPDIHMTQSGSP